MKNYQKEALIIAKKSILEEFKKANLDGFLPKNTELLENKSCFVTLKTLGNDLKGCIGSIEPNRELYLDIISNAKSAAFRDLRFKGLSFDELDTIFIEITILSPIIEKKFETIDDFYNYLGEKHPGLVIELGNNHATFLPSVWKELPNPDYFVKHLLFKAGIKYEDFVTQFKNVKIEVYFGEEFGDNFKNI